MNPFEELQLRLVINIELYLTNFTALNTFSWSIGYNGSQLHYVTEDTLVCGCGNTLSFFKDSGKHVRSLQSEGRGVGVLTTYHETQAVAYAEETLQPRIFIIGYPSCSLRFTLEGTVRNQF